MMLKTVEARKSSEASLVKAREEVAAARARANAARTIAENPVFLLLKEVETLSIPCYVTCSPSHLEMLDLRAHGQHRDDVVTWRPGQYTARDAKVPNQ